jgi:hypothetical protein
MRNLLCVIGRHDWQVKRDKEGRPYEICGRPRCYHVRGHSGSDGRIDTKTVSHRCPLNHLQPTRVLPPPDGEAAAPGRYA